MDADIFIILSIDGLANGAVYLLAGLGLVLVFSVTRVVFVPFGDIAAFSALTLAAFEAGRVPQTIAFVGALALAAVCIEVFGLVRRRELARIPKAIALWGLLPALPCLAAWALAGNNTVPGSTVLLSILLVLPMAPLVARIALQPIAEASTLVLLMVSLALHFLLSGLGLLFFGPEGARTTPFIDGALSLPYAISINAQVLLMIASALVFSGLLYALFEHTMTGKALRATAVNRVGARLVGVRPSHTALLAYAMASLMAGLIGVLIAPVNTLYYDSGFAIGLKAFVAAIIGGLVSFPLTALGALAVGVVESFASFWSGAMKDVIVFSLLIPVLLVRSWTSYHAEEAEEEMDE